ncbi:MAG: BrxA/BrxB family bacilliredoxin [Gemmatimonadaceae bacterium]|nr:BrxA/BrxB family bacilliredoxin [Gemmatimonadaceae bacterium]
MSMPRMMYDERLVAPIREDLTRVGFTELRTGADVEAALQSNAGTTLVVVNSVCGCSARMARPAVRHAIEESAVKPDHLSTVFAGQDAEATERARSYFTGYPPSSPSIALLKDGKLVYFMERWQIESRDAAAITADLKAAFAMHCQPTS